MGKLYCFAAIPMALYCCTEATEYLVQGSNALSYSKTVENKVCAVSHNCIHANAVAAAQVRNSSTYRIRKKHSRDVTKFWPTPPCTFARAEETTQPFFKVSLVKL